MLFRSMESEIINLPTNEHVDLSIIMPAYNVEEYIKEAMKAAAKDRGISKREVYNEYVK